MVGKISKLFPYFPNKKFIIILPNFELNPFLVVGIPVALAKLPFKEDSPISRQNENEIPNLLPIIFYLIDLKIELI